MPSHALDANHWFAIERLICRGLCGVEVSLIGCITAPLKSTIWSGRELCGHEQHRNINCILDGLYGI